MAHLRVAACSAMRTTAKCAVSVQIRQNFSHSCRAFSQAESSVRSESGGRGPKVILLNKSFRVLSQFTDNEGRCTLASLLSAPGFRPAGRLDYESEGLLVLTDVGAVHDAIANPRFKLPKTYWVQVEGTPDDDAILHLTQGVELNDGLTLPAHVHRFDNPPDIWPRDPPMRERNVVTSWLSLTITEGKNRQVRRMTAAAGYPTLRLIRAAVGEWSLGALGPGEWREEPVPAALLREAWATSGRRRKAGGRGGAVRRRQQRHRHSDAQRDEERRGG